MTHDLDRAVGEESHSIDAIVSDEVLRSRIRKHLDGSKNSSFERWSRNPIVGLFVGFALTWGVGTMLTNHWRDERLEAERTSEQNRLHSEASIRAINDLSRLMYERRTRAELLNSSIKRLAPVEEIRARKAAYDSVYVRWNREIQVEQLTIRDIVRDTSLYSPVESYVQFGITPLYTRLDSILTVEYDSVLATGRSSPRYDPSQPKRLLDATLGCAYVITNYLWVIARDIPQDSARRSAQRKTALHQLDRRCPKQRSAPAHAPS